MFFFCVFYAYFHNYLPKIFCTFEQIQRYIAGRGGAAFNLGTWEAEARRVSVSSRRA